MRLLEEEQTNIVRTYVVERIENNIKLAEPGNIELGLLNIAMYGSDVDVWIEGRSRLSSDLYGRLVSGSR